MFKKLKDKLAEEVKSSPQRIQQIAQAAQAAVTSASSSISDITNSDLFSIADNDSQSAKSQAPLNSQQKPFQDVPLVQPLQSPSEAMDYSISSHDILDNQRQRRLSNSSFASDVSFRLPSYETPSMYHLQSDMEVSASEAEERGFSSGAVSLDRVTKEQLYAAYRRTQERYTKYRTQYGDLARHYKLLERENAKARSVLVETQDKALRRISELREQCSLEQSAKAHLEKALRIEIEEKIMKIEALNTKVQLLQSNDVNISNDRTENIPKAPADDGDVHLINLSNDNEVKQINDSAAEVLALSNKIEKMEQLLNKYKDSLKTSKEKNSQVNTELQIMANEVESKNKEIEELKLTAAQLAETKQKLQEFTNLNEELQNKINVYEFNKTREQSTLEADYQKALEEIKSLHSRIEVFVKREEENAISLAENKLSIHKELESKEAEIRSLKDNLDASKKEVQSLNIVVSDYKKNLSLLEGERSKLMHDSTELTSSKSKITDMAAQIEELSKKCHGLEQSLSKADESYKCLQLQLKQETAEKLAMIDRNVYLENRNTQLSEENAKKSTQICGLESELQKKEKAIKALAIDDSKKDELLEELSVWKDRYAKLESEIQEERDELIKLQSEIEKLLANHELLQSQNVDFRKLVSDLKSENASLQERLVKTNKIKSSCLRIANEINDIKSLTKLVSNDAKSLQIINNQAFLSLVEQINYTLNNALQSDNNLHSDIKIRNSTLEQELKTLTIKYDNLFQQFNLLQDENNNLKTTMSQLELQKTNIDEQVKNITNQYEIAIHELNSVKVENENYSQKLNEFENNIQKLQTAMEFEKKQYLDSQTALEFEKKQYLDLQTAIELEKKQYLDLQAAIELEKKQHLELQTALELEKKQHLDLQIAIEFEKKQHLDLQTALELEKKQHLDLQTAIEFEKKQYLDIQTALELEKKQYLDAIEKLEILEMEKQSLMEKIECKEGQSNVANEELDALRDQHRTNVEELNIVRIENANLIEEIKRKDEKIADITSLQDEKKALTLENISLRSRAESIADSYKLLETEINDVRKAHAEIVLEKDHLSEIIEKIESSSCKTSVDQDSQTENTGKQQVQVLDVVDQSKLHDNVNDVIEKNVVLHLQESGSLESNSDNELSNKYLSIKTEYDILKEENRRFRSDIEGLQTYLTKISKENSILNDKLRELIATSEHSTDNNVLADLLELKNELQASKEKIDDLLRENSLLIEENLELKDQLQTQNYPHTPTPHQSDSGSTNKKEMEISLIKEKYNNLLQAHSTLEKQVTDLELTNRSVNGNMTQTQEKNEKLRLTNEKLERRLDEALVSLRHLHSLQENTELEYLRNILYEYLTGSGLHSVTLAKVLSAIVKFDDMQTKLVLQKEKERQGFLRQLGII